MDFNLDPEIVIPGNKEMNIMKKNRRQYGKYKCLSHGYILEGVKDDNREQQ